MHPVLCLKKPVLFGAFLLSAVNADERFLSCGPRNSDGNSDFPQAVVFLTSTVDVIVG